MTELLIIAIIILPFAWYSIKQGHKRRIIDDAKSNGILIDGEHCKVFTIYRYRSFTDGGVYKQYDDEQYFHEMMIEFPDKTKMYISEEHLLFCLKRRKHSGKKEVNGKMTNKWSEWIIDPDGWDERGLDKNDIYLPY